MTETVTPASSPIASDETAPPAAVSRSASANTSPVLGWIAVVAGSALVAGWVRWAPILSDRFPMPTQALAASLFYAVLFAPLIALGGVLGYITGTRTFTPGHRLAGWLPGGLGAGIAGLLLAAGFAWLNGGIVIGRNPPTSAGLLALGLLLTLIQVGAEEVVFRGWLQGLLGRLAGPWAGLALASVLFAAMHLLGGAMPPLALANIFLAGMFFGLLAWRSRGIIAPIAAHFGWNATEDLGLGLVPNPGLGPFGAVHDIEIAGPVMWGGGEEGLNASLGTTLTLVALILPLLAMRGPTSAPLPDPA
jgi:membrane protease YdiL (CAAX protease family)